MEDKLALNDRQIKGLINRLTKIKSTVLPKIKGFLLAGQYFHALFLSYL
jgi:hypothetical protein